MPKIVIDNQRCEVDEGATILEATRSLGINIPTLCHLAGRPATGACRVRVVEVEGAKTLQAACSTPVAEGMVIRTHSKRVREARRTIVELLLSEHEGNCQICERSEDCELQELARQVGLETIRYAGSKPATALDDSTPALARDTAKCIKCRRCVTVCAQMQKVGAIHPQGRGYDTVIGPAFTLPLSEVACVQCGQCAAVCPVGAIVEKSHIESVWAALEDPTKYVVVQTAPAIRAALGECFAYPPGTLVTGKMVAALRRLGYNAVFDTNFAADLTIMEEGSELLQRLRRALLEKKEAALPQFSSCSPGWIKFAEYYFPQYLPNISTCKSPQQMFGALAKTYYAAKVGVDPANMVVVSVMPCTAKKFEAQRPEMKASGVQDVDYVLTTRELAAMIKNAGIDFASLPDEEMDAPLGISSGAADIFANTGGVMEAALRTVWEVVTTKPFPARDFHVKPLAGLEGIKEAALTLSNTRPEWSFLEGVEVKVAVVHGLGNAAGLVEKITAGEAGYHFVEVMTCPGGCIGGGGQPRFTDDDVRLARIAAIYSEDEGKPIRTSHTNPGVIALYEEFLGEPLGERSHHLLHTTYCERSPA